MIDYFPSKCNLCGGHVALKKKKNKTIYECDRCGAYVSTNPGKPNMAIGILSNKEMRQMKQQCHELFDVKWKGKKNEKASRLRAYTWLADQMNIPFDDCHFGYFGMEELNQAYKILQGE